MVFAPERSKMRAVSQTRTIRPPAVAGTFYPREPDWLRGQIQSLLADAGPSKAVIPKAVIAPHAGYAYSGRVAAAAFATLRGRAQAIERVVLVGPAHYLPMRGIAAPTVDELRNPARPRVNRRVSAGHRLN